MPRPACDKLLFPCVAEKHRPACNPGHVTCHILQDNILLGTKTPADAFLYDVELVFRDSNSMSHDSAHVHRHLCGGAHHEPPRFHIGKDLMRFKRRTLDSIRLVRALNYHISLGKPLFEVADAIGCACGQVAVWVGLNRELILNRIVSRVRANL